MAVRIPSLRRVQGARSFIPRLGGAYLLLDGSNLVVIPMAELPGASRRIPNLV